MKILVTGANGFIGKNLCARLECTTEHEILKATRETTGVKLMEYTRDCDFVYHLAGVNRPEDNDYSFNEEYTEELIENLEYFGNYVPIVYSSSVLVEKSDHPYGKSKLLAEILLREYSKRNNVPVYIYRLSNVFGKWCKPNYNSVVATFCHNIANGIRINVANKRELHLMYIDDVVNEFVRMLDCKVYEQGYIPIYKTRVDDVALRLMRISELQQSIYLDTMVDNLDKYLYATYLSYLPYKKLVGNTKVIEDKRGSFSELIRGRGQVSVNIIRANSEKGGHWHDTKTERFYVVSGEVLVTLQVEKEIKVALSSGNYIDIPCGNVHSIKNISTSKEAIVIIWCNEFYNEEHPDTMTWRA